MQFGNVVLRTSSNPKRVEQESATILIVYFVKPFQGFIALLTSIPQISFAAIHIQSFQDLFIFYKRGNSFGFLKCPSRIGL